MRQKCCYVGIAVVLVKGKVACLDAQGSLGQDPHWFCCCFSCCVRKRVNWYLFVLFQFYQMSPKTIDIHLCENKLLVDCAHMLLERSMASNLT